MNNLIHIGFGNIGKDNRCCQPGFCACKKNGDACKGIGDGDRRYTGKEDEIRPCNGKQSACAFGAFAGNNCK